MNRVNEPKVTVEEVTSILQAGDGLTLSQALTDACTNGMTIPAGTKVLIEPEQNRITFTWYKQVREVKING